MKTLVIVPTLMLDCSFSAPLSWMFSKHADRVEGVYGFELTKELVQEHQRFIVELGWFIQLFEFGLIVDFIRKHNRSAEILFGGMHAGIHFKEILRRYGVDYFIQGDNELPIQLFVEGADARSIPNCVGREFANPIDYCFTQEEYANLDFNLDWFPGYFKYRNTRDRFCLPHIITAKGGCNAVHDGCEHCMGSQLELLSQLYSRPPLVMENSSLMRLLARVEHRFKEASLYLTRAEDYDFRGRYFDLDVTIEVDSRVTYAQMEAICQAFRRAYLLLSLYEEGLSGKTIERSDCERILGLEDQNHTIRFYVFRRDAKACKVPPDHLMYSDLAFPEAAQWTFYTDIDAATEFSRRFYLACDRHFVDGVPTTDRMNPTYMYQCIGFSRGFSG